MNRLPSCAEALFADALALPSAERGAFLARSCGTDADLLAHLLALVAAHDGTESLLASAPVSERATVSSEEHPGDVIGRYKLLQKIGEGGCGVVWMAEQEEPVRRRVALKVIKLGMDTRAVVARFEAERQALAMMDHPNIARVLDGGATDAGRPYFVMDLVRGIPITRFCDEGNLPTRQRLELFIQVCHAIQHAHHKGIIHRDIKPSNVLVSFHDGAAMAAVIDFGIAKATRGRLVDTTLVTAVDQFIGTPAYMSPEQAAAPGLDIDTRSDVYSLGVLLYELLVGTPPFDPQTLMRSSHDEICRIIRDVEPPRPSTQLATLAGDRRLHVAKLRSTDPAKLSLLLAGDLDWVVMKALEKNRSRRYESPGALAADIGHYLHHEPVTARPRSALYRFAKLVRRNRIVFASGAAATLALTAGTVVSAWQAVRATHAERLAVAAHGRAENLVEFMLGDLRNQLQGAGRLDLLESAASQAMRYFNSLETHEVTTATLIRHAIAYRHIGELRLEQARYSEAGEAFVAAFARADAAVRRDPVNTEALFARSRAEYFQALLQRRHRDYDATAGWLARQRATVSALAALEPLNQRWQEALAEVQLSTAALAFDRARFHEAQTGFLEAMPMFERLSAAAPANLGLKRKIAEVYSFLGSIAERTGDLAGAERRYAGQVARLEEISGAAPENDEWRFKLAEALWHHAGVLSVTGQPVRAQEKLARSRALLEPLVAQDPANRRWLLTLATARLDEAIAAKATGATERAAQLISEIRSQFEEFVATEPSDARTLARLACAWRVEAALRRVSGKPDAMDAALRAVELGRRLIREGRAQAKDTGECALAGVLAGEIAAAHGDTRAAVQHLQRARELLVPMLEGSNNWRILDPAARIAALLGQRDESGRFVSRLNDFGYIPLEPWPDVEPLLLTRTQTHPPDNK
jgi:eukaryotic-like serine/threonine-protein kinase